MPSDAQILKLFQDMLEQSSLERQAQTKAFQDSLDKLRVDMRIFNSLMLAAIVALAGLNLYFKHGESELRVTQPPAVAP